MESFDTQLSETDKAYLLDRARGRIYLNETLTERNRRNRPFHECRCSKTNIRPLEKYINWRHPAQRSVEPDNEVLKQMKETNDRLALVEAHLNASTYQKDYLPNEIKIFPRARGSSFDVSEPEVFKHQINPEVFKPIVQRQRKPESSTHLTYQLPRIAPHLRGNTTRYGCNKKFVKAARGIVPTTFGITPPPIDYQTTSYSHDFSDPSHSMEQTRFLRTRRSSKRRKTDIKLL